MENIKLHYLEGDAQEPEEKGVVEEELLEEIRDFLAKDLNEIVPTKKIAYRLEQLAFNPVKDLEIRFRIGRYYLLLNIMISRRKVLEANTCAELVRAVATLELHRKDFRDCGEKWEPMH